MRARNMGASAENEKSMLTLRGNKTAEVKEEPLTMSMRRLKGNVQRGLLIKWLEDPLYNSRWFKKLGNKCMKSGKEGVTENFLIMLLCRLNVLSGGEVSPLVLFHEALEVLKPIMFVAKKRVGFKFREVPVPIDTEQQYKIVIQWLAKEALVQKPRSIESRVEFIAQEIFSAVYMRKGVIWNKKETLYKALVENRAYTSKRL